MESRTYIYKTCSDGTNIEANVYFDHSLIPTASPPESACRPIALLLHAGGWTFGSRNTIPEAQIKLLWSLNFLPVSIDYRLCPTISLYDGPVTDSMDALDWCQSRLPALIKEDTAGVITADGSKVVAVGWSAGGHLALMLTQTPNPPLAILDFYGDTALHDPFWHSPPLNSSASDPGELHPDLINKVWDEVPAPTAFSAGPDFTIPRVAWDRDASRKGTKTMLCIADGDINRVDPKTWYGNTDIPGGDTKDWNGGKPFPPLMVLHGDQDEYTPLRLSLEMVDCVRKRGGVAEIEILKGLGHVFDRLQLEDEQADMVERAMKKGYQFLTRYVQ